MLTGVYVFGKISVGLLSPRNTADDMYFGKWCQQWNEFLKRHIFCQSIL